MAGIKEGKKQMAMPGGVEDRLPSKNDLPGLGIDHQFDRAGMQISLHQPRAKTGARCRNSGWSKRSFILSFEFMSLLQKSPRLSF